MKMLINLSMMINAKAPVLFSRVRSSLGSGTVQRRDSLLGHIGARKEGTGRRLEGVVRTFYMSLFPFVIAGWTAASVHEGGALSLCGFRDGLLLGLVRLDDFRCRSGCLDKCFGEVCGCRGRRRSRLGG